VTNLDPFSARRSRRRRPLHRPVLLVATAVLLFAIGLAFGMALNDRPEPGGTQTLVRTLDPLPQRSP
jgi:hypothetical protein